MNVFSVNWGLNADGKNAWSVDREMKNNDMVWHWNGKLVDIDDQNSKHMT